mmetsp:Transcript_9244/g.18622  ORF Transcript_9244/g.18622 Transcript_9244/m.18622 type:complete len:231 (-) Transcript_9244:484-1176(-)
MQQHRKITREEENKAFANRLISLYPLYRKRLFFFIFMDSGPVRLWLPKRPSVLLFVERLYGHFNCHARRNRLQLVITIRGTNESCHFQSQMLQNVSNLAIFTFGTRQGNPLIGRRRLFSFNLVHVHFHTTIPNPFNGHTPFDSCEFVRWQQSVDSYAVLPMKLMRRQFHFPCIGTVVRNHQEPFGGHIETTDRFQMPSSVLTVSSYASTPETIEQQGTLERIKICDKFTS